MTSSVRIGNASGFWGDRLDAAAEMLAREPELDFLTLDFLAEVSMSILALQRSRDPEAGWPRDFLEIVRSIAPYWRSGGRCRIITNAGGLNPAGCAKACLEALEESGCGGRTIAIVSGDNVLELVRAEDPQHSLLRNLDTGEPIARVRDRLATANAYLGARPIVEALARGADLVIAGRVADPSLTVGPCAHAFDWSWDDWDRLAGATVAGHLIECSTHVTGGISTDWLDVPDASRIGFPIVEVAEDGGCTVTKPRGTGGRVSEATVKEQLVYEIGDPAAYLSPDVTVSFLSLRVEEEGPDRVRVRGAAGRPPPATLKVSATWQDGYRAEGRLTVVGADAVAKARRAGQAVLDRLRADGVSLRETLVECLGAGACRPQGTDPETAWRLQETVLRVAVADDSRESVERFARELMPLVTAGPPGTTGYAEGRPRVHPMFRFWPCLIERERVQPRLEVIQSGRHTPCAVADGARNGCEDAPWDRLPACQSSLNTPPTGSRSHIPSPPRREPATLADIAFGRSGDKGIDANIGLVARRAEDVDRLRRELTGERVATYFGMSADRVERYELPNLGALNFILHGILANPLRVDAQGKGLAQVLLAMPLEKNDQVPEFKVHDGRSRVPEARTMNSVLLVDRQDPALAILTLNRPERRNALSIELMEALCRALEALAGEPEQRVVLLRGAGPVFCAGLDLHEAAEADRAERSAELVARMFEALLKSPLVTVAAVHGAAYAGGAGVMACCDFAVAADDLRIAFPEVRRGLVPALVAAVLRDRLREGDLKELFLLAEPIDAQRARSMGLVDRVVPGPQLMPEAQGIAGEVMRGAPEAVRQTRQLLRELRSGGPASRLSQALEFHKQARRSEEAGEGLAAFREHRRPDWDQTRRLGTGR